MIKAFTDLNLGICNCSKKVLCQSANTSDRYKHFKFMAIFGYEWPIAAHWRGFRELKKKFRSQKNVCDIHSKYQRSFIFAAI